MRVWGRGLPRAGLCMAEGRWDHQPPPQEGELLRLVVGRCWLGYEGWSPGPLAATLWGRRQEAPWGASPCSPQGWRQSRF